MSSFTGKSIHCVSHTEIRGWVLRSHIAHLQVQGALVIVSEDSESILYGWCVVYCTAIRINVSNPLHGLPRCLSNPAHPEATKSKPWAFTRESPWPPRLHQASSSLQQLHFTLDICKHRKCCSINCQTCPLFLIFMSTHIFSIYCSSIFFFYLLKEQKWKLSPVPTPCWEVSERSWEPEPSSYVWTARIGWSAFHE